MISFKLATGRYEKAMYGIIAILATLLFAILSIATYTTSVEAYTLFLVSLVALVVMGLCLLGFKIAKAIIFRDQVEPEEPTEDNEDLI